MASPHLRPATPADVPEILKFIRELAEYVGAPYGVTATEELIHKSLFDPSPIAHAVLAELDGAPVGFAFYFFNFSTWVGKPGLYLEDLYVRPSARRAGVGRLLLAYLARVALDRGCERMEWSVLDWNESAIEFYKSFGAIPMDEATLFRLTGPSLNELASVSPRS